MNDNTNTEVSTMSKNDYQHLRGISPLSEPLPTEEEMRAPGAVYLFNVGATIEVKANTQAEAEKIAENAAKSVEDAVLDVAGVVGVEEPCAISDGTRVYSDEYVA